MTSSALHNDHRSSGLCNGQQINSPRICPPPPKKKKPTKMGCTKKIKLPSFL